MKGLLCYFLFFPVLMQGQLTLEELIDNADEILLIESDFTAIDSIEKKGQKYFVNSFRRLKSYFNQYQGPSTSQIGFNYYPKQLSGYHKWIVFLTCQAPMCELHPFHAFNHWTEEDYTGLLSLVGGGIFPYSPQMDAALMAKISAAKNKEWMDWATLYDYADYVALVKLDQLNDVYTKDMGTDHYSISFEHQEVLKYKTTGGKPSNQYPNVYHSIKYFGANGWDDLLFGEQLYLVFLKKSPKTTPNATHYQLINKGLIPYSDAIEHVVDEFRRKK